ncbi:MAG: acyl carrier protein [Betaproteobacteria bacterium]|nr:acyl carrier protein [Betaproteobacteria bacterium]
MQAPLKVLLVAALVAGSAMASHLIFTQLDRYARLALLWIWLPLATIAVLMVWRTHWRGAALAVALVATALLWHWSATVDFRPGLLFMLQYLGIYGALCALFAATLRAGRGPLVTRLTRGVHGQLPPEITRYTRQVTVAWVLFFAVMAAVGTGLYAFAPVQWWSLHINFFTPFLIGVMFVLEYLVRRLSFPNFQHVTFMTAVKAFRQDFNRRDE